MLVVAAGVASTACGGSTAPRAPLIGAYELETVNGIQLPVPIAVAGTDTTFLGSQLMIVSGPNSYSTAGVQFHESGFSAGPIIPVSSSGTYAINGSTFAFHDGTFGDGSGMLDASGTLSISFSGKLFVFGRVQ